MWGHREVVAICKLRREASGETKTADTSMLDFQNFEKETYCLWPFVVAALGSEYWLAPSFTFSFVPCLTQVILTVAQFLDHSLKLQPHFLLPYTPRSLLCFIFLGSIYDDLELHIFAHLRISYHPPTPTHWYINTTRAGIWGALFCSLLLPHA